MPDEPAPEQVAAARVTFFPGNPVPWVEIWTRQSDSGDPEYLCPRYGYHDLNRPQCETQQQWLDMLATGTMTTMTPAPPNKETPQ